MGKLLLLLLIFIVAFCSPLPPIFADNPPNNIAVQSALDAAEAVKFALDAAEAESNLKTLNAKLMADINKIRYRDDWQYTQSVQISNGKYGTSLESSTYVESSTLQRNFRNASLAVTIPYVWQTGNVVDTSSGIAVVDKKKTQTISGLGDVTINGNYYLLQERNNAPLNMTLTGYLKTPTASSKKGLGTGETDGGFGAGFSKKLTSNLRGIADASFVFIGKVPDEKTFNQIYLDNGLQYILTPKTAVALKYEYSNAAFKGTAQAEDLALSLTYRINNDWVVNGEFAKGLTNGSPDEMYLLDATIKFDDNILKDLFSPLCKILSPQNGAW